MRIITPFIIFSILFIPLAPAWADEPMELQPKKPFTLALPSGCTTQGTAPATPGAYKATAYSQDKPLSTHFVVVTNPHEKAPIFTSQDANEVVAYITPVLAAIGDPAFQAFTSNVLQQLETGTYDATRSVTALRKLIAQKLQEEIDAAWQKTIRTSLPEYSHDPLQVQNFTNAITALKKKSEGDDRRALQNRNMATPIQTLRVLQGLRMAFVSWQPSQSAFELLFSAVYFNPQRYSRNMPFISTHSLVTSAIWQILEQRGITKLFLLIDEMLVAMQSTEGLLNSLRKPLYAIATTQIEFNADIEKLKNAIDAFIAQTNPPAPQPFIAPTTTPLPTPKLLPLFQRRSTTSVPPPTFNTMVKNYLQGQDGAGDLIQQKIKQELYTHVRKGLASILYTIMVGQDQNWSQDNLQDRLEQLSELKSTQFSQETLAFMAAAERAAKPFLQQGGGVTLQRAIKNSPIPILAQEPLLTLITEIKNRIIAEAFISLLRNFKTMYVPYTTVSLRQLVEATVHELQKSSATILAAKLEDMPLVRGIPQYQRDRIVAFAVNELKDLPELRKARLIADVFDAFMQQGQIRLTLLKTTYGQHITTINKKFEAIKPLVQQILAQRELILKNEK